MAIYFSKTGADTPTPEPVFGMGCKLTLVPVGSVRLDKLVYYSHTGS